MGVYVKDMEMPECCIECPFGVCFDWDYGESPICCSRLVNENGIMTIVGTVKKPLTNRHPDCPLVEVKTPHDEDAKCDECAEEAKQLRKHAKKLLII